MLTFIRMKEGINYTAGFIRNNYMNGVNSGKLVLKAMWKFPYKTTD